MGSYFMLDTIVSEEALKRFVAEMRTSITNYCFGDPKSREYILLQKFQNHPMVCCLAKNCFNPLGHIVNFHQNVELSKGGREWSHETIPHTSKRSTTKIGFKGTM